MRHRHTTPGVDHSGQSGYFLGKPIRLLLNAFAEFDI